ncbi:PFU-domain-containing protein [Coniochaeta sp. PMI_546]|nr:PFU-domain-containing protein [Coniochaeta sp. PMI_546]
MSEFKLSAQLRGHNADVRAVLFPSPDLIFSTSRDQTVRAWRRTSASPPQFEPSITTQGHAFINSLTYIRPGQAQGYEDGLVVSGGQDTIIEVRKPTATPSDNAERLLIGHGHNVCTLDVSPKGTWIVSGGWDGQARVWSVGKWETELLLKHDSEDSVRSVWSVLALDENTVVTGSADNNVRLFDLRTAVGGEVQPRVIMPTPAVVRALCKIPSGIKGHPSGAHIASASNDGVIRLWKVNGQQVGELHGHDSYIYSLASLPTGEIVSSGEDRTVRIWSGTECVQTITHPAISVWSVAVCSESGDIVSGASDNMVRVFTRSPERAADAETIAQFQDSVKASAIPQQQLNTTINKEKLDGPDWLKKYSGSKDGQVKMIREDDGSVTAHQWSLSGQEWIAVGTVVDAAGSSGKKVEYNGKEFDYVFDVDIEDGKPPLKLPYNLSENPYERATKFLGDNELPLTYLDSVANFIVENTKGATIGQATEAPGGADPYGSESRYRPGDDAATPPKKKYLPHAEFITLTQAKFEPIQKKVLSVNANLIATGNKQHALNPSQESILKDLVSTLTAASGTSKIPTISDAAVSLVIKLATEWPYADRLPGLDLLRCIAPSPALPKIHTSIVQTALSAALEPDTVNPGTRVNENTVMMALRTITNLFASPAGRSVVAHGAHDVVSTLERIVGVPEGVPSAASTEESAIGKTNRNVQIALTSVAFNYACLAYMQHKKSQEAADVPEIGVDVLALLCNILGKVIKDQNDSEVLYRALMALGMMLAIGGEVRDTIRALDGEDFIRDAIKKGSEDRVKDVGAECLAYLR